MKDNIPKMDVITLSLVLHDWNLQDKLHILQQVYNALPGKNNW